MFYAGEIRGTNVIEGRNATRGATSARSTLNLNVDASNIIPPRSTLIFFAFFGLSSKYLVLQICYIDLYWINQKCRRIQSLPRDGQGTPEFRAATVPFEPFEGEARDGIPDKQSRPFPFSKSCIKPSPLPRSPVYLTTTTTANTTRHEFDQLSESFIFYFFEYKPIYALIYRVNYRPDILRSYC